jgi:hypothetical protein
MPNLTSVSDYHSLSWDYKSPQIEQSLQQTLRDQKIQDAVTRLINQERVLFSIYASTESDNFPINMYLEVVSQLKTQGYELEEEKDIDDGSSLYGSTTEGLTNYISVQILSKPTNEGLATQKET